MRRFDPAAELRKRLAIKVSILADLDLRERGIGRASRKELEVALRTELSRPRLDDLDRLIAIAAPPLRRVETAPLEVLVLQRRLHYAGDRHRDAVADDEEILEPQSDSREGWGFAALCPRGSGRDHEDKGEE